MNHCLLLAHLTTCGAPTLAPKAHRQPAAWHHGRASVYSYPQPVAAGGRLDVRALTCAHRTLPFGTRLELRRGRRTVVVVCNDRGPFVRGRDLDLTPAAAAALGFTERGLGVADVEWRLAANRRVAR